ncbi:MAG: PSD1 and planctomycete cytochrome C domain-containing protein, partial [Pirellulales bacterium]
GQPAVAPGDVESSYLIDRVTDPDPDSRMPPADHGPPLSADEIALVKRWIREGAKWEQPWAFMPPEATPRPTVKNASWCAKPLDYYVLAKLEAAGLAPSPPASRREWLRRVSFDLIGLPPSTEDVEEFVADTRPDAYERVVDRLLASPHFGERWAAMWLDLARYADTTGFEHDPNRDIWPYRDWVIRAFNADMPYDQFTIKQLAGDLVELPTVEDRLATAFHRNTQTNSEGGTDDEEYRIAAVIDRINTTWQVWQATTFGCVQCHSHPYDPFKHEEYYQFMALFDDTRDADVEEDYPKLRVPLRSGDFGRATALEAERKQLLQRTHERVAALAEEAGQWRNLSIDTATSTGSTQLRVESEEAAGDSAATDVFAEGTISTGSKFTLEAPFPSELDRVTAARIDALTRDPEAARRIPELGFVLSQLEVEILVPDQKDPLPLKFQRAFSDEVDPILDPNGSLDADPAGWASYSRQWRSHYAVFVLDAEMPVPPGSRIRIRLAQDRATVGDAALVIGRGRYSVSADGRWPALLAEKDFQADQRRLAELKQERDGFPGIDVPVTGDLDAGEGRSTFEFVRGLWLDKGAEMSPGTPQLLPPLPAGVTHDRLSMARWLVSPENPLAARVMANRLWEQLFGMGLVETVEDFGTSGALPSNPELLDHLALRFQNDFHWSMKRLLRELVLSSTYRQTAAASPESAADDPQNLLISHGPRQRLSAEMVRDQALVLSNKFSPKMYGPPVMPPQPDGIWRSVYNDRKWETAQDENRFRRAIYTFWKRTSAYPSMTTFDAPSRESCTARRIATNTPLQALVTLNDEAYVELAAGLADRMVDEGGATPAERISWAYQEATGREPAAATLNDLTTLYEAARKNFDADRAASQQVAATPELAALSVVASAILNLDEVLTR